MDRDKNCMTERLLSLALEVVYLLIEEDYVIVKKSGGHVTYNSDPQRPIVEPSSDSRTCERNNEKKILQLTNKIIQLLTGEEWDYLQAMDDEKQNMGRNCLSISHGISSGRTELTKHPPTSVAGYLRKNRIVTVSPHEITSSVNTDPQEDGHLPEIYIHVPIEQAEYLSVCHKGGTASGDLDNEMDNNICKPTAHRKENSIEERNSTCQMEYKTIKIKEEPVQWEEEGLSLNSDLHIQRENLTTQANNSLHLYKKSLSEGDHTTSQCTSTYIKQEGGLAEIAISTSAENTQQPFTFVKTEEDSASCANEDFRNDAIDVAIELSQTQYISTRIKEEFCDNIYNEDYNLDTRSEELSPALSFHKSHSGEISHEYYSAHSSNGQQGMETPEKPFSCSDCGKCFKYKSLLFHHAKSHQKKPLICGECGKQYSCKTEFDIHQRIHTGEKPFLCSDCGKGFRRKSHMLRHQRIHGDKETFPCPECGKCFHRLDVLNQHRKIHRTNIQGTATPITTDLSQEQTTSAAYEEKEVLACSECGKCYNELSLLERHQRSHVGDKPFSCTECGKAFRFEALLELHWGSHIKTVSCPECGKRFASQCLLSHHLKSHAGENECTCSECGKEFPSKSQLLDHFRTHTGEKPYMCPDCGKHFRRKAHVVRHRKIHTGDKPFVCLECGKCFESQEFLSRHAKMHKRKRPYVCPQCGKSYTKSSHLARHKRTHIRDTCSECGEYFPYPALLNQHMKTHNDGTSQGCSESGENCDSSLVKHQKMRSKEKSFICIECGKSFAFYSHFMRHQTLHTGEKPYGCPDCEKRFTRESHLVRHRRSHISE